MLELQRNVIFGQFIDTGSVIHRMDPRIKLAAVFVMLVASFLIDSFLGFAVVLPLLILIQVVSRIPLRDRKSTRLNSSHANISYAVFCLKKKTHTNIEPHSIILLKQPTRMTSVVSAHDLSHHILLAVLPTPFTQNIISHTSYFIIMLMIL